MTNREWLYSLVGNDLSEWFDAEHVEADTSMRGQYTTLIDEYNKQSIELLQAKQERDEYREKLSKVLDISHEIMRVGING